MKVVCCRCRGEYSIDGNLFEVEKTNRPLLKCPHCGFEHLLDFIPVTKGIEKPRYEPIEQLDLGPYYLIMYATRIADKDRVDQSGSDNGDVTGWNKANEFILCTAFQTASKGVEPVTLRIDWRNVTDLGSFTPVTNSGEITYVTTETVLSDNTSVVIGERKCSAYGADTWQDGRENENDNISPDTGTFTLYEDYYTEFQWALDCSGAQDGKEYEFRVWDTNNNREVGVCGATITMSAAETEAFKDIPLKVSIESPLTYKDVPLKVSVESADTFKDIPLKLNIESAYTYKDIPLKVSVDLFEYIIHKDIPLKVTIESEDTYKDVPLKITVESAYTYKDVPLKVSIFAEEFKDIPLKVSLESADTFKDIPLKITIESDLEYKDIALKVTVESADTYKDIPLKVSLEAYRITGVTKLDDGTPLSSVKCFLMKDNLDNTASFVAYTLSDGTGNYTFYTDDNDAQYFVIFWKDTTPHVFDVTDHVLQPETI